MTATMTPTVAAPAMPLGSTQKANVQLTFGPISVGVSVHSAVAEDKEASLRIVCTGQHGVSDLGAAGPTFLPMNRVDRCPECGNGDNLGRAKEVAEGLIPIPAEVLKQAETAEAEFGKEIKLVSHLASEIDALTRPTGSRYYLNVKVGLSNNYALMRQMIRERPNLAFVARFSLKGAAYPYRLMLDGDTLMLVQLADPTNLRARPAVEGEVVAAYLELALTLADQDVHAYVPSDYVRPKARIISEFIEGKTPTVFAPNGAPVTGQVTDLLEALKASVAATAPKKAPRSRAKKPASSSKKAS